MSTKAVIAWLALAVLLGLAALFLLRTPEVTREPAPGRIGVGEPLMVFSPGDVVSLTVTPSRNDQPVQIIEKAPGGKGTLGADAEWQLRLQAPLGSSQTSQFDSAPWPVAPAQMQALLRVMGQTSGVALPPEDASLTEQATTVELRLKSGTAKWRLATRTLAGTGMVEVTGVDGAHRIAIASDELLAVFTNPGPLGWRESAIFAGIVPDASRIRLSSKQQKLLLSKVDGRWLMLEPIAAPADPGAVQRAMTDISRVQVVDFLDAGTGAVSTGLEQPVASIEIEADRRLIEPSSTEAKVITDRLAAAIGGAADASNSRLFASINDSKAVVVSARTLQSISTDPTTYIWPHPTRLIAADIGSIVLDSPITLPTLPQSRTFKRELQRWTEVRPDASTLPVSDQTRRDCEAAIIFLTGGERSAFSGGSAPASSEERPAISFELPKGARQVLSVRVLSATGQTLDTIVLHMPSLDRVVVQTGSIYRTYLTAQLPTLLRDPALAAATELKIPELAQ